MLLLLRNTCFNTLSTKLVNYHGTFECQLDLRIGFFPRVFFLRRIWILKISWLNAEELITYNDIVFEFTTHPQKKPGIFMEKGVKNGVFSGVHAFHSTPPSDPPCRIMELQNCRIIELQKCRNVESQKHRNIEMQKH